MTVASTELTGAPGDEDNCKLIRSPALTETVCAVSFLSVTVSPMTTDRAVGVPLCITVKVTHCRSPGAVRRCRYNPTRTPVCPMIAPVLVSPLLQTPFGPVHIKWLLP